MRTNRVLSLACSLLLALAVVPLALADDAPAKVLTPEEAAKHPKEKVTVRMEVKAVHKDGGSFRLDAAQSAESKTTFSLLVRSEAAAKFRKAGVKDPAAHFKGKTVLATGTVHVAEGRAYIDISDPDQIKLAQKDGDKAGDKKE